MRTKPRPTTTSTHKLLLLAFWALAAQSSLAEPVKPPMDFSRGPEPTPQWFRCEADSDCVHVRYSCADGVVNKAFAKDAAKHYGYLSSVTECISEEEVLRLQEKATGKKADRPPYQIYCEAKQCKHRGIPTTRPGFS